MVPRNTCLGDILNVARWKACRDAPVDWCLVRAGRIHITSVGGMELWRDS